MEGDEWCASELYGKHRDRLFKWSLKMSANEQEDFEQDDRAASDMSFKPCCWLGIVAGFRHAMMAAIENFCKCMLVSREIEYPVIQSEGFPQSRYTCRQSERLR